MARIKIDYGIDLGTTNSAISRMENGEPVIKKTDTLKDTMPSCVYIYRKKSIRVGDSAYNKLKSEKLNAMKNFDGSVSNSFIEFKRTMGTDKKYSSSNLGKDLSSEELSAEVLKTLNSFITDENIKSVVVTVPAKFTVNQKDATLRAAKLAGFEQCELLQEPIAASMAYGLDAKNKNGYWLVFDFGGGTFDVALLKVEDGIQKVIDTEGDNYLGGKNLDYAIVDEIIIPYIQENNVIDSILSDDNKKKVLQDAMKFYAEEIKIQMSFKDTYNFLSNLGDIPGEDDEGEEIELDIDVTQEMMQNTLGPIFQKSIDLCKHLLERNNLERNKLDSFILVGGPTYSPILRKMLEEQIVKPDISVDPMTVVSKGAALFASTVDVSDEIVDENRNKTKIQLELSYEATTVEEEVLVTVKILKDKTEGIIPEKVFVEIVSSDKAWSSGKTEIDDKGDIIEVKLDTGKPNAFDVLAYDEQSNLLESEPSNITIIQGIVTGNATLPYFIGIEIKDRVSGKHVFRSIKGLEKNQPTPATGITDGLKTQKQIRPGIKEDKLKIPIYQGEHGANGTKAIHNEHVYDVIITGDDLEKLLPESSDIEITIKVDKSERMKFFAFFPYLDFTYEIEVLSNTTQKEVDANWLEDEITKAQQTLSLIKQGGVYPDQEKLDKLDAEISEIKNLFEQRRSDYERKKEVLNRLRGLFKKLDEIETLIEWPKKEEELKDVFYRLEKTNKQFGNDETTKEVEQFKEQIPEVIKEKNVKVAQEMIDNMRRLDYIIKSSHIEFWIGYIRYYNDGFDMIDWKDKNRARMTLDRGLQIVANNPTIETLRPIVIELFKLLRDDDPVKGPKCKDCGKLLKDCVCHLT